MEPCRGGGPATQGGRANIVAVTACNVSALSERTFLSLDACLSLLNSIFENKMSFPFVSLPKFLEVILQLLESNHYSFISKD